MDIVEHAEATRDVRELVAVGTFPGDIGDEFDCRTGWYRSHRAGTRLCKYSASATDGGDESPDGVLVHYATQRGEHPLRFIFGPQYPVPSYEAYSMEKSPTWTLPHALTAPSNRLTMTYRHLQMILSSYGFFNELVPQMQISPDQSNVIRWNDPVFHPFRPRKIAPLGTPSMVTASRETGTAQLANKKGGLRVSMGFLNSREGTDHFARGLVHLATGMRRDLNWEAAQILATADELQPDKCVADVTVAVAMDRLRRQWACLQVPDITSFVVLMRDMEQMMASKRGEGSRVVMSDACAHTMRLDTEKNEHWKTGPPGYAALTGDIRERMSFQHQPIYVMLPFLMETGRMVHPFERPIQIGGYVSMYDESMGTLCGTPYNTTERSRLIVDMTKRGFHTEITLRDAIRNCQLFDFRSGSDGALIGPEHELIKESGFTREVLAKHFTWRQTARGGAQPIAYIGELPGPDPKKVAQGASAHRSGGLSPESRRSIGQSLFDGIPSSISADADKNAALTEQLLRKTALVSYLESERWIAALAEKMAAPGPALTKKGLVYPGDGDLQDALPPGKLPPGFDTWAGLKELTTSSSTKTLGVYGETVPSDLLTLLSAAGDFTTLFETAVTHGTTALGRDGSGRSYCSLMQKGFAKAGAAREDLPFNSAVWCLRRRAYIWTRAGRIGDGQDVQTGKTAAEAAAAVAPQVLAPASGPDAMARAISVWAEQQGQAVRGAAGILARSVELRTVREGVALFAISRMMNRFEADKSIRDDRLATILADPEGLDESSAADVAHFVRLYSRQVAGLQAFQPLADGIRTDIGVSREMAESLLAWAEANDGRHPAMMPESVSVPGAAMSPAELAYWMALGERGYRYFAPIAPMVYPWNQTGLYGAMDANVRAPLERVFRPNWDEQAQQPGPKMHNVMAQFANATELHGRALLAMADQCVRVPIGFLACSPHRTWTAEKVVLCGDFGRVAVKQGNVVVNNDAVHHLHLITCDHWTTSFAHKPLNYVAALGPYVKRYVSGEDTRPLNPYTYNPQEGPCDGSIIYVPVPADWREAPTNLNLQGNMYLLRGEYAASPQEISDLQYPTAPYCNAIWGWRRNEYGITQQPPTDQVQMRTSRVNVFCRPQFNMRYDPRTGNPSLMVPGNDYWSKETCYPGCGDARQGRAFDANPDWGQHTIVPDPH